MDDVGLRWKRFLMDYVGYVFAWTTLDTFSHEVQRHKVINVGRQHDTIKTKYSGSYVHVSVDKSCRYPKRI